MWCCDGLFIAADRTVEREAAIRMFGAPNVVVQERPVIAHVAAKYQPSSAGLLSCREMPAFMPLIKRGFGPRLS